MNINIIYAKDRWYIHYTAEQLKKRLPANTGPPTINYYINYALYGGKTKNIDIGHFTHAEPNGVFEKYAREMDWAICMSPKYEKYLRNFGIETCSTITPGIDEFFKPKLILGNFGRFNYPHRKGYELFNKVKEQDWIYLKQFNNLPREELPKAYSEIDYVLVTSRYEGGPMCLLEGLACGKEIICPTDVGLAEDFPVISYKNSDWESLLMVLQKLYRKKLIIAESVKELTWDNYAEKHMEVFKWVAEKKK